MDKIDYKILSLMQDNSRIPNTEIARQLGMAPSGILERIRKLEDSGCIEEYTARLKAEALNLGLAAFIFLRTSESPGCCDTSNKLAEFPEVLEVHHVAGEDCYLVKVRLENNQSLAAFMREKIGSLPKIASTRTVIVLETIKETSKIKLPDIESEGKDNGAKPRQRK